VAFATPRVTLIGVYLILEFWGTHGRTYYKSPAVEAKNTFSYIVMQVICCVKFCNMTKSGGGTIAARSKFWGTCPPVPRDLRPWLRCSSQNECIINLPLVLCHPPILTTTSVTVFLLDYLRIQTKEPLVRSNRYILLIKIKAKAKAKARDSYIARLTGTKPDQPRFTIIRSGS